MTHIHHIDALFEKYSCRIVFVDDRETAQHLIAAIREKDTRYIREIRKEFQNTRKVGPFKVKNKQSLFNILKKAEGIKADFEWDKPRAVKKLTDELEAMDLAPYADRSPRTFSTLQKFRASILYEVIDEQYRFILCDHDTSLPADPQKQIDSRWSYRVIAEYMRKSENFAFAPCELIWITALDKAAILTLLGKDSYSDAFYNFYALQDGAAVELDKAALMREFEAGKPIVDKPIAPPQKPAKATRTAPKATAPDLKEMFNSVDWDEFREYNTKKFAESDKTQLRVIGTVSNNDAQRPWVSAMIECGSVRFTDSYRSLRTGTTYAVIYPPVDITYLVLKGSLEEEGGDDMIVAFKELGYDIEKIRHYYDSEEFKKIQGDPDVSAVISAGDNGMFTSVGFVLVAYEGKGLTEDSIRNTFDLEQNDILEKIT